MESADVAYPAFLYYVFIQLTEHGMTWAQAKVEILLGTKAWVSTGNIERLSKKDRFLTTVVRSAQFETVILRAM